MNEVIEEKALATIDTKIRYEGTEKVDTMLKRLEFTTQEGTIINDTIVLGQKEIGECILRRSGPNGENKVHVMAHTRYGKSLIIAATVLVRAAFKQEKWAIVAPTKDQAQIIMDYVLHFAVQNPLTSELLRIDPKVITNERLTQRRSRDHITFLNGGEIRTYAGTQTMGHGAANVILDEAALVDDESEAKVVRMLGDHPNDFFLMKVGNPFENNHFRRSHRDQSYYKINIDYRRGLQEGRLSQAILDEQKGKPFYDILYKNVFPDEEGKDKYGYLPLLTHKQVENAQVEVGMVEHLGAVRLGVDPNDGGDNEAVAVKRTNTLAEIKIATTDSDPIQLASDVSVYKNEVDAYYVDKQGVGSGTVRMLEQAKETKRKLVPINAAKALDKNELEEGEDPNTYSGLRAYIFWKLKEWVEGGGKLARNPKWVNLLDVRYKIKNGKIYIITKEELRKPYYNVDDLGVADALSFTFSPEQPLAGDPNEEDNDQYTMHGGVDAQKDMGWL